MVSSTTEGVGPTDAQGKESTDLFQVTHQWLLGIIIIIYFYLIYFLEMKKRINSLKAQIEFGTRSCVFLETKLESLRDGIL